MEKKRTMYSLESDIRRILEDNDFVDADGDESAKQWYMNLVTDLAVFVQQELDRAREEGSKDGLIQLLGLLKGIDNTLELQVLVLGLERKLKGEDAGLAYETLIHKLTKLSNGEYEEKK